MEGNHLAEILRSLNFLHTEVPIHLLVIIRLVLIVLVHLYFEELYLLFGNAGLYQTPFFELLLYFRLLCLLHLLLSGLLPHLGPRHLRHVSCMVPPTY